MVRRAAVTYLEGYLFDRPPAKEAFEKAAAVAHREGGRVALTLSDRFCVTRYGAEFRDLGRLESRYRVNGLSVRERADLEWRFDQLAAQVRFERHDHQARGHR